MHAKIMVLGIFEETWPGRDVTSVTNAMSEQIKADTVLAFACEVCIVSESGPSKSAPTTPV